MRSLLVVLVFLGLAVQAKASHIIGGEMYYDYLGNNVYRLYIALYRDCASTGAQYDDPLILGVFDSNNNRVDEVQIPFPGSVNLPVVFNNPCVTPPSGICAERAIYTFDKLFPPTAGGYTLAYQRCCRGPNVTNLNGPDDTGLTLTCFIPGTPNNNFVNSSARFTNYPPLVICNNEDLLFDHSATDPDGDLLTYELVTPNAGANSVNPAPNPIPNPPYPLVSWAGGFTPTAPLGAGSTTTINPNTGALYVDANLLGLYVVGIRVNEWRNGVIISSTTRDFLFRVVNCIVQLTADVSEQEDTPGFTSYCQGLTFTFDNQSSGSINNYMWDFGVAGTNTDVSTAFEPTYTFPSPGTYNVMLIANPGWPCTDTTYVELTLNNPFNVDVNFQDSLCFINNAVDFQAVVNGPAGTQLTWDFGPNSNPQSATTINVNDVNFTNPTGNYVKLVGETAQCADSVQYPIFFFNPPTSNLSFEPNHECLGFTQTFLNNSTTGTYYWDFGVNGINTDVSTQTQPTYTYPGAGTYNVTLIAEIVPGCSDTLVEPITVYEPLVVDFQHPDSLCVTNNSINFVGNVQGPSITTYNWNFGNAVPASASTLSVNGVHFNSPGNHLITLTASFLTCSESATSNLFLYREPTIDFSVLDALRCAPHTAQFISNCTADTDISYSWNFGDGGTSNLENPSHLYPNPGQYTVTLQISTDEGCVTTLTQEELGLIVVHPNPIADFTIDKNYIDICNSYIQFTNQSQGALNYYFVFDDANGATSNEENPYYGYVGDGNHNPYLIVENEFGCTDTARANLFIEPFTPYIPNTFTPDGNEFNNDFRAVLALEAVEWKMEIFSRWGELVYTTTDQYDYWDGTFKGLKSPDGVYIYKVTYIPCGIIQEKQIITGHVNLLR